MSYYVSIRARHRPFPLPGLDEDRRVVYTANFEALSSGEVSSWEDEVVKILLENDPPLVSPALDTFIGSAVSIPSGPGPYIQIINTGGKMTNRLRGGEEFEKPTIQVLVRAEDDVNANAKILAIWRVLDRVVNRTVEA